MLGDDNSFYCGSNEKIYGGESQLWSLYAQSGIVGVYFVVGHEYGHHFLSRVGSVASSRKIRSSFHNEQGADCYAGALIAYAHTRGYLSERPLSLAAQRTTMAVADPVSIQGYHGAYHERYDAYSHGDTYGAIACER